MVLQKRKPWNGIFKRCPYDAPRGFNYPFGGFSLSVLNANQTE